MLLLICFWTDFWAFPHIICSISSRDKDLVTTLSFFFPCSNGTISDCRSADSRAADSRASLSAFMWQPTLLNSQDVGATTSWKADGGHETTLGRVLLPSRWSNQNACKTKMSWSFLHSSHMFEVRKNTDDAKWSHFFLWEAVRNEEDRRKLRWRSKNTGPCPHQGLQSVYISYLKKKRKCLKCQHIKQPPCHWNDCY